MLKYQDMKKQHGGHTTGFLEGPGHSQGSGKIFDIRKALGFSQPEMADFIGCTKDTISRAERQGKNGFRSGAAQRNLELLARRAKVEL